MSHDNEKNECGCGCGEKHNHEHKHDHECGCGGNHEHEHECGCGGNHDHDHECGCGCGDSNEGCGCGCGHEHGHRYVTLVLEDDTELKCPVISVFEVNEKQYIALLHPVEETVLLFRLYANEDGTIDIDEIEDDAEFELVSNTFTANY